MTFDAVNRRREAVEADFWWLMRQISLLEEAAGVPLCKHDECTNPYHLLGWVRARAAEQGASRVGNELAKGAA